MNVKHLKVFGSIAYTHIPAETRTKLDDQAKKIVFVGYKCGGSKLFNSMTKKGIVSQDVTFAEEAWKYGMWIPIKTLEYMLFLFLKKHKLPS